MPKSDEELEREEDSQHNQLMLDRLTYAVNNLETLIPVDAADGMEIATKLRAENRRIWGVINDLETEYWQVIYDIEQVLADAASDAKLGDLLNEGVVRINPKRLRDWCYRHGIDLKGMEE